MEVEGKHNKIKTRESFLNRESILNGSVIRLFNELSSSVSQFSMDRVKKKRKYRKKKKMRKTSRNNVFPECRIVNRVPFIVN